MKVNDKAPEFTLPDEEGSPVKLKDYLGKNVVLFFYPKANTPGCTKEVCDFRDAYTRFEKEGVAVFGISADKPSAQKKFKDKFELPYHLLADEKKEVANGFGVIKERSLYGRLFKGISRMTFVIGPKGKVTHIFDNVKPVGHAQQVMDALKKSEA